MTLTAANNARTTAALAKRIDVNGDHLSFSELLDAGEIAYVRTRTFRDGKRTYGVILHDDALSAIGSDHDTLAEALAYVPFYDAPKMVTDAIHADGLSRVVFNHSEDAYTIDRVALDNPPHS